MIFKGLKLLYVKHLIKKIDTLSPLCYTIYAIKKGVELMKHFNEKFFLDTIRTFINNIGEEHFQKWGGYEKEVLECGTCLSGLYRCVFIPKERNFVIKLARKSIEGGERQLHSELENYRLAQENHLHNWFAKPLAFGDSQWGFWVAFEYVDNIGKAYKFIPEKESVEAKMSFAEYRSLYYVDTLVRSMRSIHYARLLEQFCEENDIDDLHSHNYGWNPRKNHIVITDYGGC